MVILKVLLLFLLGSIKLAKAKITYIDFCNLFLFLMIHILFTIWKRSFIFKKCGKFTSIGSFWNVHSELNWLWSACYSRKVADDDHVHLAHHILGLIFSVFLKIHKLWSNCWKRRSLFLFYFEISENFIIMIQVIFFFLQLLFWYHSLQ